MNQRDLSLTLSKTFAIPRRETTLLLRFIVEAITKSLARGDRFSLPNLGVFHPVKRAAKKVRHPKTGEIITSPAYSTVSFRPAPALEKRFR